VYSLGLGEQLVGVTRYCKYPSEAEAKPHIGGFFDISIETIVSLRPDVVIGLPEHESSQAALRRLQISVMTVSHSNIAGIKESIHSIGERCGVQAAAARELATLSEREDRLAREYARSETLRTLVAVGRTHEGSVVSGVYVSGKDGYYSSVLSLVGMRNVNDENTISLPTLSPEGLLALNPEAIVEVVGKDDPVQAQNLRALWDHYPQLPAVAKNRITILTADYATIPGPRYIKLAEDIATAMYSKENNR
jgi:iron complex transport system substrate-binding protein